MTPGVRVNKLGYKPCEYTPQRSCFEHSLPMTPGGRVNKLGYQSYECMPQRSYFILH